MTAIKLGIFQTILSTIIKLTKLIFYCWCRPVLVWVLMVDSFAVTLNDSDYLQLRGTFLYHMSVIRDISGVYAVSRFLWSGECCQSKLTLSNLGALQVGNVRLYRSTLQRRNIHADTQHRDRKGKRTSLKLSTIIFLSLVVGLIRQARLRISVFKPEIQESRPQGHQHRGSRMMSWHGSDGG